VHKEGFARREPFEMNPDKVESGEVGRSIAGRIVGWGDVTIRGVGEGAERVGTIGAPLEVRNHVQARLQ
jgi:hypothetical protein